MKGASPPFRMSVKIGQFLNKTAAQERIRRHTKPSRKDSINLEGKNRDNGLQDSNNTGEFEEIRETEQRNKTKMKFSLEKKTNGKNSKVNSKFENLTERCLRE